MIRCQHDCSEKYFRGSSIISTNGGSTHSLAWQRLRKDTANGTATLRPGLRFTGGRQSVCWEECGGLLFGGRTGFRVEVLGRDAESNKKNLLWLQYTTECSHFTHPFSMVMLDQFQLGKFWVFFGWWTIFICNIKLSWQQGKRLTCTLFSRTMTSLVLVFAK